MQTEGLRSDGAAVHEIASLEEVNHQQLISIAQCNNITLQERRSPRHRVRQPSDENAFKNA
ncbi:hypothetical protein HNQ08_001965 [Deinococcus humi]|uniref:Uncharacterized protein n=2 Tax=Deinococcus humi TaxID=662880 RepID=A0A7W8NGD3_9DEIO|nr:hypothetical protein [Deinococcus humi]